jgi:hypothetical protein
MNGEPYLVNETYSQVCRMQAGLPVGGGRGLKYPYF